MSRTHEHPRAVLFDRDGTLVVDVPYNGDPSRVAPLPTVATTLTQLRRAGVPLGVVSNQSGIGRGTLTLDDVDRVNERVEKLLGPFDVWQICPHVAEDCCDCRKPKPGMIVRAAAVLGLSPAQVAVVGDIGADIDAARAAGARGVLVPTAVTRVEEVRQAEFVAPDVATAVSMLFSAEAVAS